MRVKTDAKRNEVLQVAAAVFRENGYERTTMGTISARLGGSKNTLYRYFESKAHLFLEVAIHAGEKDMEDAISVLNTPGADLRTALVGLGTKYVGVVASEQGAALHRMVIGEAGHSDIGVRFLASGPTPTYAQIQTFLEQAIQSDKLRTCDAKRATYHLMSLLHSECLFSTLFAVPPVVSDLNESVAAAVDVFLAAYGLP
jgi:AcrR family transcriptional regulator